MDLPTWTVNSEAEDVARALKEYVEGRNVLITGCTIGGLGFEAAKVIANYAHLVVITGRSQERYDFTFGEAAYEYTLINTFQTLTEGASRLEAAKQAILTSSPHANVHTLIMDLASLTSVREAATKVLACDEPLHVLINNAAAPIAEYRLTNEGIESQFGVNHLAHFLFTLLLLPKTTTSPSTSRSNTNPVSPSASERRPRIVVIASEAHKVFTTAPEFDPNNLNFDDGRSYNNYKAYGRSKTANFLFAQELIQRMKGRKSGEYGVDALVFTVQPGAIWTNSSASTTKEDYIAMGAMDEDGNLTDMFDWRTMGQGAAKYIIAAFDPRLEDKSGGYVYNDGQIHDEQIAPYASDSDTARKLWSLSEKLVGYRLPSNLDAEDYI